MTAAPHNPVAERRASGAVAPARSSRWLTGVRVRRLVVFIGLCLVGVSTIYPLIFMALNSMRSAQAFEVSPYGLPTHYSLSNFHALFNQVPFLASILHSIIVVVPAVMLATLFSALVAFVFTKTPIKLGNVPVLGDAHDHVHAGDRGAAPAVRARSRTSAWPPTSRPRSCIYTAISIPYGTYLLRSNFRAIPDSVIEAARVDGGNWRRIFYRVVLPMGRAGHHDRRRS